MMAMTNATAQGAQPELQPAAGRLPADPDNTDRQIRELQRMLDERRSRTPALIAAGSIGAAEARARMSALEGALENLRFMAIVGRIARADFDGQGAAPAEIEVVRGGARLTYRLAREAS
ncbi:hypothetical protein [Fodinicurvata sediminis]|uniref:hypothetical protein n=1 Tax=Fodinicurvata sediminis TaxID=1121832 RepID=UPI0003B53BC9|nr:hypothetical protein [Fodinicurvata sediminis]